MARKRRKRIKFSPFRLSDRTVKSIIVGLGVVLIAIFAVPVAGPCRRPSGGFDPNRTWARLDGERITLGEKVDLWGRWTRVFNEEYREYEVDQRLALVHEAERAGIRVSDEEVKDAIHNYLFPRRAQVEYAIAETRTFEKKLDDSVPQEERAQQGAERARQALEELKAKVDAVVGADLEGALKRLAGEGLVVETAGPFTELQARTALEAIAEAPGIERRAFTDPVGRLSEPLRIRGGYCMLRVILRTRGFDPGGHYHAQRLGWVSAGYGVVNEKEYAATLRERRITQLELEQTIREQLAVAMLQGVVAGATTRLPDAVVRERYARDSTEAVAAWFAMRTSDFTEAVRVTGEALRSFYDEWKHEDRTDTQIGYRRPEQVKIEYVLGRTADLERMLPEATLRSYYERDRAQFEGTFQEALPKVRSHAAEHELKRVITDLSGEAAAQADEGGEADLEAIAREAAATWRGAFVYGVTDFLSRQSADATVRELQGARLGRILFGEQARQYVLKGEKRKEGQHVVSTDFECDAGRFFFCILARRPAEEVAYEDIDEAVRTQLRKDFTEHEAFRLAQQKATEYRGKIHQDAFKRLAQKLGAEPVTTEFLLAEAAIPPVGEPIPALYAELAGAELGDLSRVVPVGEQVVVARLADRQENAGLKLEVLAVRADGLGDDYEPAVFELQAAYDADPYRYLDQPKPIPFEEVKGDIAKLLARRRALDLAAERVAAAIADLAGVEKPDLPAAAEKHKLTLFRDVKVDLAQTEAAPHVGRAAGLHDAVTALEPGEVSRALASADGRFVFVVKARDERTATLDVAAALYDTLLPEVQVGDQEARDYYDACRDTAYVTGDEIKEAPPWSDLPEAARDRVRAEVCEAWREKPALDRAVQLRNACVQEAFRTVPTRDPLTTSKSVRLNVRAVPPFSLSKPRELFAREPDLLEAVKKLQAGEVGQPTATKADAVVPFLAARKPGGEATVSLAVFQAPDFLDVTVQPPDDALQRYYDAHKAELRIPETAVVEFLFAEVAARQKVIEPTLSDDECRRYYQEHRTTRYSSVSYEEARARVRSDLAGERADREARRAAEAAFDALRKNPAATEAEVAALAAKHKLTHATSKPLPLREPVELPGIGRVAGLAAELRLAEPGELIPRVAAAASGHLVCRLARREPARIPTLDEARERVVRAVRLEQAREAARKAAERFREAAARTSFDRAEADLPKPKPVIRRKLIVTAPDVELPGGQPAPALAEAIFALEGPGLTPVVTEHEAACSCVAYVTERKPDELLDVRLATIRRWEVAARGVEPTDEELKAHYEAHKERFRVPDQLQVEYLAVLYDDLARTLEATEEELRQEYDRSTKARETLYKDWDKPGLVFLPFEEAKDTVRQHVIADKAKAEGKKVLEAALETLKESGAAADFKALAAREPALQAGVSSFFERETEELEPIGSAQEVIEQAFAAKEGEVVGPVFGADGACLFRRGEFRPSHVPPLEKKRFAVKVDLLRQRDIDRALEVARELRAKVVEAVAEAEDKAKAFEAAVEAGPLAVEIPNPVRVAVTQPFRPAVDTRWGRMGFIPGLGNKPDLVQAVFRTPVGHMSAVVDDPDRSACYVAAPTRFLAPDKPTEQDLKRTRAILAELTASSFHQSWMMRLDEKIYGSR